MVQYPGWRSLTLVSIFIIMKIPHQSHCPENVVLYLVLGIPRTSAEKVIIIRVTAGVQVVTWRIFFVVVIKIPICVLVHPAFDDGILFFRQVGLDPDVIEAFDVGTNPEMEC